MVLLSKSVELVQDRSADPDSYDGEMCIPFRSDADLCGGNTDFPEYEEKLEAACKDRTRRCGSDRNGCDPGDSGCNRGNVCRLPDGQHGMGSR